MAQQLRSTIIVSVDAKKTVEIGQFASLILTTTAGGVSSENPQAVEHIECLSEESKARSAGGVCDLPTRVEVDQTHGLDLFFCSLG